MEPLDLKLIALSFQKFTGKVNCQNRKPGQIAARMSLSETPGSGESGPRGCRRRTGQFERLGLAL
jgi:hypothetical protein